MEEPRTGGGAGDIQAKRGGPAAFPTEGATCFKVGKKRYENKGLKPSRSLEHGIGG